MNNLGFRKTSRESERIWQLSFFFKVLVAKLLNTAWSKTLSVLAIDAITSTGVELIFIGSRQMAATINDVIDIEHGEGCASCCSYFQNVL